RVRWRRSVRRDADHTAHDRQRVPTVSDRRRRRRAGRARRDRRGEQGDDRDERAREVADTGTKRGQTKGPATNRALDVSTTLLISRWCERRELNPQGLSPTGS